MKDLKTILLARVAAKPYNRLKTPEAKVLEVDTLVEHLESMTANEVGILIHHLLANGSFMFSDEVLDEFTKQRCKHCWESLNKHGHCYCIHD